MKRCSTCKQLKSEELYNKNRSLKDGLHSECKECNKAYYYKNRDAIAAKKQADKDRIREVEKQYRASNKEIIFIRQQKWRENNKEYLNIKNSIRHKRHRLATPLWADLKAIEEIYKKAKQLNLSVDHIIPLNGVNVSGLHVIENLQLLSKSENCAKWNNYNDEA